MKRRTILTGLLVGFALAVALVAVTFFGDAALGLPLVPFDIFAWLTRVLPGPLITFGIDSMVNTLILLGFDVSDTAKTAERMMAVMMVVGSLTVLGAVLAAWLTDRDDARAMPISLGVGVVLSITAVLVRQSVSFDGVTLADILWLVGIFAGWGLALGWSIEQMQATAPAAEDADEGEMTVIQEGRRSFLIKLGGAAAAITVIGAGVALGSASGTSGSRETTQDSAPAIPPDETAGGDELPDVDYVAAEPVPGTRSEITPVDDHYLIDINPRPPELDEDTWRLSIMGLVNNPVELSLDEIRNNYSSVDRYITLSCISNRVGGDLIGTTLWTGVPIQEILAEAGIQNSATAIEIRSVDGFHEMVDMDLINAEPRIMLAYAWDGQPLTHEHGFPLRIWIPDRFGMKQPRWITEIEAIDERRPGYWVQRGWSAEAIVKTTSVVDTVAEPIEADDGSMLVPVGGIAYAGDKGISRVEVQVDNGDWQEADLLEPLSGTTWVLWRYEWPFEDGRHTFRVRTYDASGEMQITMPSDPRPDGATGIHDLREML